MIVVIIIYIFSSSSISDMELAREVISGLYGGDRDYALQELNKIAVSFAYVVH